MGAFKVLGTLLVVLLSVAIQGCSKDNEGSGSTINAQAQTFTGNGINNCSTSIGSGSTFLFNIPYTTTDGVVIDKLLIKTTVSNGESDDNVTTVFTDSGSVITWANCFRFGSQDWGDFEVRLQSTDGTTSNPTRVRVNKPAGAN